MPKKDFSKQTVAAAFFSTPPQAQRLPSGSDPSDLIINLPVDRLFPYPDQPFRAYAQDKLWELAEDIKLHGVMSPIIVRPLHGDYQILSGHNRVAAAQLAKFTEVPCVIKTVNDEEAALILVNTNLNQRQQLLPSEKARAYRMQMEAMNRQGKRTDLTLSPRETKLDTAEEIARQESRANVFRYLRLNQLHPLLLEKVDAGQLPFKAAVQLSYLTEEQQIELCALLQETHCKLDEKKAAQIKAIAEESGAPIAEQIKAVFVPPEKTAPSALTKKITIVVPADQTVIEQLRGVQRQWDKGSGLYFILQKLLEKLT